MPPEAPWNAADLLRRLVGMPLATLTGRPNTVLAVSPPNAIIVTRKKYLPAGEARPFFCDAWVESRQVLIEAKHCDSREALRMAIGQLFDYRRFHQPGPAHLAVLLPHPPDADPLDLLRRVGIEALWPDGNGFRDSAAGALT